MSHDQIANLLVAAVVFLVMTKAMRGIAAASALRLAGVVAPVKPPARSGVATRRLTA